MTISTGKSSSAEKKDALQAHDKPQRFLEKYIASRGPGWLGIPAMMVALEIVIFLMLLRFATHQPP